MLVLPQARWLLLCCASLVLGSCYRPVLQDCRALCGPTGACPDGMSCGADLFCHQQPNAPACPSAGNINGTVNATSWNQLATAHWVGNTTSPLVTALYFFSGPFDCAAMGTAGWKSQVPAGLQVAELQLGTNDPGPAAGDYGVQQWPVAKDVGSATLHVLLDAGTPAAAVVYALTGKASLYVPSNPNLLEATFSVQFNSGETLTASGVATACPAAYEW